MLTNIALTDSLIAGALKATALSTRKESAELTMKARIKLNPQVPTARVLRSQITISHP